MCHSTQFKKTIFSIISSVVESKILILIEFRFPKVNNFILIIDNAYNTLGLKFNFFARHDNKLELKYKFFNLCWN